jgi:hypothetical protein
VNLCACANVNCVNLQLCTCRARAPSWVVLSGPARHGWACLVSCSDGIGGPSGGMARPGYLFGLKRARAGSDGRDSGRRADYFHST